MSNYKSRFTDKTIAFLEKDFDQKSQTSDVNDSTSKMDGKKNTHGKPYIRIALYTGAGILGFLCGVLVNKLFK
jgi:hypothetical protein